MFAYEQCKEYLRCLNAKDLSGIVTLFTPSGTVSAPLSGELPVGEFHRRLFSSGEKSVARLTNVFSSLGRANATALQFHYTWFFPGEVLELEGISVFEMAGETSLIQRLKIIYDPTDLARHLARVPVAAPCRP